MKKIPKNSICNKCENALITKIRTRKTYDILDGNPEKFIEDVAYKVLNCPLVGFGLFNMPCQEILECSGFKKKQKRKGNLILK
jgi:hypothetical protein